MTLAIIGYRSAFQTNYSGAWVTLSESVTFSLPPVSRDVVDASHECMPREWRNSLPGYKRGGEVSVAFNFTPAQYGTLRDEIGVDEPQTRRVWLPDGTAVEFDAYLTGLDTPITVADKISANAKFKVTGPVTLFIAKQGAAKFSGSGNLKADGRVTLKGAQASLKGSGSVAARGTLRAQASALFYGEANFFSEKGIAFDTDGIASAAIAASPIAGPKVGN